MPKEAVFDRIKLRAAFADSFITSPSWPVKVSPFFPFMDVASINKSSPPAWVQASPMATPGVEVLAFVSDITLTGPRYLTILPTLIDTEFALSSAILLATPRQIAAISRSRFLKPASRVYPVIILLTAPFVKGICPAFKPWARL